MSSITSSWSFADYDSNSMANGFSKIWMHSSTLSKSFKWIWNCSCKWVITSTAKLVGNSSLFSSLNMLQVGKWTRFLSVNYLENRVNFNLKALLYENKSEINEFERWSFKCNSFRSWVISYPVKLVSITMKNQLTQKQSTLFLS